MADDGDAQRGQRSDDDSPAPSEAGEQSDLTGQSSGDEAVDRITESLRQLSLPDDDAEAAAMMRARKIQYRGVTVRVDKLMRATRVAALVDALRKRGFTVAILKPTNIWHVQLMEGRGWLNAPIVDHMWRMFEDKPWAADQRVLLYLDLGSDRLYFTHPTDPDFLFTGVMRDVHRDPTPGEMREDWGGGEMGALTSRANPAACGKD